MRSPAAAEAASVEGPAKAARPAPRKRTTAARAATPRKRPVAPKATPAEIAETVISPTAAATKAPRHSLRALAVFGFVLAAAGTVVLLIGQRDGIRPSSDGAVTVSAGELASFASGHDAPVYWAGEIRSRTLEFTSTDSGAFVRYLPPGVEAGTSTHALTVATYPMRDAYATASRRATEAGMTSRTTRNDGLAVWSTARPTSVYVAFRGVPALVEVYAPAATEARRIALSDRVRPVG